MAYEKLRRQHEANSLGRYVDHKYLESYVMTLDPPLTFIIYNWYHIWKFSFVMVTAVTELFCRGCKILRQVVRILPSHLPDTCYSAASPFQGFSKSRRIPIRTDLKPERPILTDLEHVIMSHLRSRQPRLCSARVGRPPQAPKIGKNAENYFYIF